MRVLNLCTQDIAGIGHRTAQAFAKYAPEWTFDHVVLHPNYLAYPAGRPVEDVPELVAQADVVMLHQSFKLADRYGIDKPLVLMHHGTKFRLHHEKLLARTERRGAVGIASTLDLWLMAPDQLEWAPPCYNLDWLATLRQPHNDDVLKIGHAPTNRAVKSTDAFLRAVKKLGREMPVQVVLIERKPWHQALRLKGTCDAYYDQVKLTYGCNSVEAWGMGIPVIAGAPPHVLDEYRSRFGSLPFVEATEDTIHDALIQLTDPTERATWSRRGLDHAAQWHDEKNVVEQLQQVYRRAARS